MLLIAIVAFCLLLLAVRFVAFPRLENNRDELTRLLAQQIGQPIEISALATGWDGWNPRVDIRGFRILDSNNGVAAMTLPQVRLVVAWTSLLFLDLRLKELVIDGPQLAVRRAPDGMLHLAGATIDPAAALSDDTRLAAWLLRQPRIVIHDAELVWRDELANGSQLVLEHVQLRIENRFGHHRFGLTGMPPSELAAPLDLRGDITGTVNADWRAASGRFYARLDYADIAAWREWLPMSVPIRSGKGALRVWFEFVRGEARNVVADVVLADVQAKLAPDLPELTLSGLEGRLGWSDDGSRREFYTQHLTFAERKGVRFDPTDFKLTLRTGAGADSGGRIEFTRLELTPLRQIAAYLPLPAKWRDALARVSPRGTLERGALQWEGGPDAPHAFSGSGRFIELGFAAQEALPGVSGLSGNFDASPQRGTLKLDSHSLALEVPRLFADRLAFDSLQGQVRWHHDKDALIVNVDELAFANQDLAGNAKGDYTIAADGPGTIDASAQLTRADGRQLHHYAPLAIEPAVRNWLRTAVVAGTASDLRLKLVGRLADFPFADAKTGQFQLLAKAQGVTLDYVEHWPPVAGMDADVRVDGARVVADVRRGRVFGVDLNRSRVEIGDVRLAHPVLRIDGSAAGPTADFLRFITESPLDEWMGHVSDGVEASGNGRLALQLELPLGKPEGNKIAGDYVFDNDRLKLAGGAPVVDHLNGKLAFSGHEFHAPALTAEMLGGPARFSVTTVAGRPHIDGQGSVNLAQLRTEYPQQPLAARFTGSTDWKFAMSEGPAGATWVLDSSLRGAVVDLPSPAGKLATETVPLKIERRTVDAGRDVVTASYGRIGKLTVERRLTPTAAIADRALMALGDAGGEADRRGFWVRGAVDALDLDGWLAVKEQVDAAGVSDELPLSGVELSIGALEASGRQFKELRIGAVRGGSDWQIDLRGREVAGSARWQAAAAGRPNGRLVARLQRLTAPSASAGGPAPKTDAAKATSPWPELDITADSFTLKNHELGKLELIAKPNEADWRIESIKVTNDDGKLQADGWWRIGRRAQQTQLDVDLDVRDAGKYLARFGAPDAVRGAPTHIRGQLAWAGNPQEFDYPTLGGTFRVDTGAGQFIKLDPGLGKLLGVLSLQALKRRLAFDFQDLFGEGFAFDDITGDVRIQDGVMRTDNLTIVGVSARATITGETDIARETQKLKVRVQPTLSAGLSVGAAALLLANPIIGAAIGAGSLLAQKVMQDPFEQMFSYVYLVTGSWSDPQVERAGRAATATGPAETMKQ